MSKRKRRAAAGVRLLKFPIVSKSVVEWPTVQAAAGDAKGLPKFHMNLYNGGPMWLPYYDYPVIVDLKGMTWTEAADRPVLRDHSTAKIVGHTTKIWIEGSSVYIDGVVSGANEYADEVAESGQNGFPWRTSMGAKPLEMQFVREGETRRINSEKWEGPFYHSIKTNLYEASFVALGADDTTNARIAAQMVAANESEHGMNRKFRKWLLAKDWGDPEGLTETQLATLQAQFESETGESADIKGGQVDDTDPDDDDDDAPNPQPARKGKKGRSIQASGSGTRRRSSVPASQIVDLDDDDDDDDPVADFRAQMAAEKRRIQKISQINGITPEIEANAIENNWSMDKTELEVIRARASSGMAPMVSVSKGKDGKLNHKAISAALCISAGVSEENLEKDREYGADVLEAAAEYRDIGLQELYHMCIEAEGHYVPYRDKDAIHAAGFTTHSISTILGNSLNKMLMSGYESIPMIAPKFCKKRSLNDFKPHTMHRLLGTGEWDQVGSNGQLRHGVLGEESYTVQADTYGKLMVLDRKTFINDDLGAFMDLPVQMGQDAANKVELVFADLLLNQTGSFFTSGNGNVLTGSGSDLSVTGLTNAHTKFRKRKSGAGSKAKDKRPINVVPRHLLVPVELEVTANLLMTERRLITGEDDTKLAGNPHVNKYEVTAWPHLSDTDYFAGASAVQFYLAADPQNLPGFILGWLKGRDRPVIEDVTSRQPAQFLEGKAFRGYSDFGFGLGDPNAWLRAAGTA